MGRFSEEEERFRERLSEHKIESWTDTQIRFASPNTSAHHIEVSNIMSGIVFTGDWAPCGFKHCGGSLERKLAWVAGFLESPCYGREKLLLGMGQSWHSLLGYDHELAQEQAIEHIRRHMQEREGLVDVDACEEAIEQIEYCCSDGYWDEGSVMIDIQAIFTKAVGQEWGETTFGKIIPHQVAYFAVASQLILKQK